MRLDDEFDGDDPYHVVALIFAGFQCEKCYDYFSGDPTGNGTNADLPYGKMGENARVRGWWIENRGDNDWLVRCPKCRSIPDCR